MNETEVELLRSIAENTRTIAQLLATTIAADAAKRVETIIDSPQKRLAYRASDGIRSAREVARLAGVTHPTIISWWKEWAKAGLVEGSDDGRSRSVLNLDLVSPHVFGGLVSE